eukprot:CAMPEP_0176267568 /NCGR_PEP_ID=MMETSP0121_2-20121125/43225_1 /TAXON_ID=160619 /ORGANISM="Kryptoperidinium foliaceum, Strain CCMP 1326" /LENGTH=94 /DNA_ID=CAMNT_0017607633 /DNA_START=228 /DNA_END=508 /DNA_ORIENTATION=-
MASRAGPSTHITLRVRRAHALSRCAACAPLASRARRHGPTARPKALNGQRSGQRADASARRWGSGVLALIALVAREATGAWGPGVGHTVARVRR